MRTKAALVVLCLACAGTAWAAPEDALHFATLDGASAGLGDVRLVAFWSSDCVPCLREMEFLPEIAKQNADLSIALISLKDASHTRAHLAPMPDNVKVLVAQASGREVLGTFGNERMLALPFSVMLDKDGAVCARHYGILGGEKVKAWRKECHA